MLADGGLTLKYKTYTIRSHENVLEALTLNKEFDF